MHEKKLYSKIIYENMKNKNNECLTSSKNVIKKSRLGMLLLSSFSRVRLCATP